MAFARGRRRQPLEGAFFRRLRWVQLAMLVQPASGVALWALGLRPRDPVHLVYGAVLVAILLLQRGLAPGRPFRQAVEADWGRRLNEGYVYAGLSAFACLMVLRAISTALFGF
jgi:hypothetical protein